MDYGDHHPEKRFEEFQQTYLIVYFLAVTGDWLQGPFVYALYEAYGLSKQEIEWLFVAGFVSSLIFGTIVGSFADRYGRKNNCILYGFVYITSCLTKHFDNFWILLFGRLFGGIASSLLHTAFESWAVNEHRRQSFTKESLSTLFSHAYVGNFLIAIAAGVVSQYAVNYISLIAPFDIAVCVFMVMLCFLVITWTENYGSVPENQVENIQSCLKTIITDKRVLCLGIVQSLFESAMYCFILEWTPSLTFPNESSSAQSGTIWYPNEFPHGYVFACFMTAMMIGTGLFKIISKTYAPENFMRFVLGISAICLALPIFFHDHQAFVFAAFLMFEMCVGIFCPSFAVMRSKYIAEERRATIMNIFKVPLNLIVAVMLSQNVSIKTVFTACVTFLIASVIAQQRLYKMTSTTRL